jgi:hypothetical protein
MPLTQQHTTKPPLPTVGSVCSTITMTSALQKEQRTLVKTCPFETMHLWLMEKEPYPPIQNLGFQCGFFPSHFPTKMLSIFFFFPVLPI